MIVKLLEDKKGSMEYVLAFCLDQNILVRNILPKSFRERWRKKIWYCDICLGYQPYWMRGFGDLILDWGA